MIEAIKSNKLLTATGVAQVLMIVVLFSPVLGERQSYRNARDQLGLSLRMAAAGGADVKAGEPSTSAGEPASEAGGDIASDNADVDAVAQAAAKQSDISGRMSEKWAREVFIRDLQVLCAVTMLVGLFVNSFVLCALIDKTLRAEDDVSELLRRNRIWNVPYSPGVIVLFAVGLIVAVVGMVGFYMSLKRPSPLGLWSMVAIVLGVMVIIMATVWSLMPSSGGRRSSAYVADDE